jgi:hypothetical protein
MRPRKILASLFIAATLIGSTAPAAFARHGGDDGPGHCRHEACQPNHR